MKEAGETDSGVWTFTWWWFALVFLCATQDIAVDGKETRILQLARLKTNRNI
jgi:PAT family acetyl-CoA transporter-like MFS transporter 1